MADCAGSALPDDRRLRLGRRRRDPGRPEGVRRRGLPRHVGDRRADRPEHGRRHRRARGAARVRPGAARGGLLRHRRRRGQDGDAVLGGRSSRRSRTSSPTIPVPLVVDPVMVASSGARLLQDDAVEALVGRLFPLATVVTPNLPEAEALAGQPTRRRALSLLAERAPRARRAGGDRHRRSRRRGGRPPLRRAASTSRSRSSATTSPPRTAPAARTRPRSPRRLAARTVAARRRPARPLPRGVAAVAHGLAEIGAGEGPVDVLGIRAAR